jgi:hypothetical protein
MSPLEQLPPITDTGANTFGCLVNGVPIKPNAPFLSLYTNLLYCRYYKHDGILYFQLGANDFKNNAYFSFYMDSINLAPGTYKYSAPGRGSLNVTYQDHHLVKSIYTSHSNTLGEFKITKFDTTTNILAGTFWFDTVDTATNRKVEIREGRFDLYVRE